MAAESEMKPAAAGGGAVMIVCRMARGRRVGVMQGSRSEQGAVTAGVDRRAGRRANGGGEGPPRDARPPGRGDRREDARTTREAAGSVKKPTDRAGVGVEAHGVDGGGGDANRSILYWKTKNKSSIKMTGGREKTPEQGLGEKTL